MKCASYTFFAVRFTGNIFFHFATIFYIQTQKIGLQSLCIYVTICNVYTLESEIMIKFQIRRLLLWKKFWKF